MRERIKKMKEEEKALEEKLGAQIGKYFLKNMPEIGTLNEFKDWFSENVKPVQDKKKAKPKHKEEAKSKPVAAPTQSQSQPHPQATNQQNAPTQNQARPQMPNQQYALTQNQQSNVR